MRRNSETTGETTSMMFQGTENLLRYCKTITVKLKLTKYQLDTMQFNIPLSLHDSTHLNYYLNFTSEATKAQKKVAHD